MPANPKKTINQWMDNARDAHVYDGESLDDNFFDSLKAIEEPQSLANISEKGLELGPVKIQRMGLVFSGSLTESEWKGLGQTIRAIDIATPWFYGDLVNHVKENANYGNKADLVKWLSGITGYSTGTLENLGSVAGRLQISSRDENLSAKMAIQVFRAVNKHGKTFDYWLAYARERNYSASQMEAFVDGINPDKTAMQNFNAKWRTFTSHTKVLAKDLDEDERVRVAGRLRNLARRVESGGFD